MIISKRKLKSKHKYKKIGLITASLILCVSAVCYSLMILFNKNIASADLTEVLCDAENIIVKNNKKFFKHKNSIFSNGSSQSNEKSLSGKYSAKVHKENQFAMSYTISNVNEGEIYEASVWKYSEYHVGTIVAQGNWNLWRQDKTAIKKNFEGWELLKIKVIIPRDIHNKELKFYVWNPDTRPAYFDDLKIIKLSEMAEFSNDLSGFGDIKILTIKIDDKGLNKLKAKRDEAFKNGILVTGNDDFVKVKLIANNNEIPAFARLKGDWLDHLKENKWSFRIKTKKNYAWNRMKEFSVQNPLTRHFIDEWVFHKLLEYEDILTPTYDFIVLHLNNKDLGIYAYEEHFTNQLLQRQRRKESVIIKFDEDGLWDARVRDYKNNFGIASFEGSEIKPFSIKNVIKSEKLLNEFKKAQNLMFQYKYGIKTTSEIFDIDKLARYYAILDITKAFHAIIWHNQRMYLNPVTEKLEPIGFDGYSAEGVFDWIHRPFIGYAINKTTDWKAGNMLINLFHDHLFVEKYISYLEKYSNEEYLHDFFSNIEMDLIKRELLLQTEFTDYKYDKSFLYNNAANIRNHLIPYEKLALKVYLQNSNKYKLILCIGSTHALPIELIGIGNNNMITSYFSKKIILPAYNKTNPIEFYDQHINGSGNMIFYKVLGLDSIYTVNINPWPAPIPSTSAQELLHSIKTMSLKSNKIYRVKDSTVIFYPGNYKVEKNVIIPEHYSVKFLAGCNLDFINYSKFISKSPVYMYGNEEEPIVISSSDGTSGGFTVLQADKKSFVKHVIFNNINALNYKGWKLEGAVTFYESDVEMTDCKFSDIHAEDALNIIRSNFIISNIIFTNCTADAFDADFCKGKITDIFFQVIGKDAFEFSGSIVEVKNCHITKIKENAVNATMEAKVVMIDITIKNSKIAISSRDLSEVDINYIELTDCEQGLVAYQQNPEYGGARIIVHNFKYGGIKRLYSIEQGSVLKIDDKVITGNK